MLMIKVAINGFGRVGRMLTRVLVNDDRFEVVGINDLAPLETMAHLFQFDSVHGRFNGQVGSKGDSLIINGKSIRYSNHQTTEACDWHSLQPHVVFESSGKFKTYKLCSGHLAAGSQKVILTAPPADDSMPMVVLGVNEHILENVGPIISNASCTTNNAAPMVQLLDQICGIESCYISTIHSYTVDQNLHDAPHLDLRRARAASQSIVPTTTGAAKALTRIFPHLALDLGGCGIRVPVPDGSLTDITCVVKKRVPADEINQAFKAASANFDLQVLEYSDEPLVSRDIVGSPFSCVFDSQLTSVIGRMVKVVGWYDNEIGYSHRLVDLAARLV